MELTELFPIERWAILEQELHQYSGLNVHVYNKQGRFVTPYNAWANSLCPLIRSFPQGLTTICAIAQQSLTLQAKKTKCPAISECDAGFAKFVIPIHRSEEFLGTIGGCGQRFPGSEVDCFLISKITGRDMQELQQTMIQVKEIQQDKMDEIVQLFQKWVNEMLASSA